MLIGKKYMKLLILLIASLLGAAILLAVITLFSSPEGKTVSKAPYMVSKEGIVDQATYQGFTLFSQYCAHCHGEYAQGRRGPNLADRLKRLSQKDFFNTVENGKGRQMPSWRSNKDVMAGRALLYRYLRARSEGAIGEVEPHLARSEGEMSTMAAIEPASLRSTYAGAKKSQQCQRQSPRKR